MVSQKIFILTILVLTFLTVSIDCNSFDANLRVLYRSLDKCSRAQHDLGTCIRLKALTLMERALKADTPVVINEYLSLTPDKQVLENVTSKSEQEIEAVLPKNEVEKDAVLDEMLADKVTTYLQSRSLQFTIPAAVSEGRKKDKDKGGMMMMGGMAMGGMLIQMALAKIALLAGKALIVGKMALLLASIIGLKSLFSHSGGGESHQVVYASEGHGSGGGGGGGWGRSLQDEGEIKEQAQNLAYRAQARTYV